MHSRLKKLDLGDHDRILVFGTPDSLSPVGSQLGDVKVLKRPTSKPVAFAIGFAITQKQLDTVSRKLSAAAEGGALVWIAYPRQSSKNYACEFNRDSGWQVMGKSGFEAVRQVSIDEDWSTLRFRRVEFTKSLKRSAQRRISAAGKQRPQ